MNEPLVISQDAAVLSLVQSSAATIGIGVQLYETAAQARRAWPGAPLVIVGVDQAASVVGLGLPERTGVHVVGTDADAVLAWSVPLAAPGLVLPRQAGFLTSLLDDAHRPDAASGAVLRLFGATGGLGTSTLAMGLAVRMAKRGRRVALVELDPAGGGLDVMAGAEGESGWRWGDLTAARGHVDDLSGHLPSVLGVDIVAASRVTGRERAPNRTPSTETSFNTPGHWHDDDVTPDGPAQGRPATDFGASMAVASVAVASVAVAPAPAVTAVLAALRRTHDLVVIDHGHLPPAHEEAVLVVGADVRSVLAAQAVLASGLAVTRAVVRAGPGRRLPLDLIAESLGVTPVGVFPHDPRLPNALEAGDPPGRTNDRTSRALDKLVDRLGLDHLALDRLAPDRRGSIERGSIDRGSIGQGRRGKHGPPGAPRGLAGLKSSRL